ncbi:MAG TPA: NUDIX hydrolase [Gaiellaceae bacterium]|jgi:ADP-ribose pyrophosphatase|nr:NUDIX hydrolase [Gaiellaceae bacterium]
MKPDRRETVWSGKLFDVVVEEWGGATRELVEHPSSVAVVAFDREGRLVLARQLREGAGEELLELPAGVVDEGEDELAAAQRELREETGLHGGRWRLLRRLHPTPGYVREPLTLFVAEELEEGEQELDQGEDVTLVRFGPEDLDDLVARLEDAKTVAGVLLVLRERAAAG